MKISICFGFIKYSAILLFVIIVMNAKIVATFHYHHIVIILVIRVIRVTIFYLLNVQKSKDELSLNVF